MRRALAVGRTALNDSLATAQGVVPLRDHHKQQRCLSLLSLESHFPSLSSLKRTSEYLMNPKPDPVKLSGLQQTALRAVLDDIGCDNDGSHDSIVRAARKLREAAEIVDRVWPRDMVEVLRRAASRAEAGGDRLMESQVDADGMKVVYFADFGPLDDEGMQSLAAKPPLAGGIVAVRWFGNSRHFRCDGPRRWVEV